MTFPMLLNSTNTTTEILTTSGDIELYFPTLMIIGFFLLFLYMAETRRDIGYAFFMLCVSTFAVSDTLISSVSATNGIISVDLSILLIAISGYELIMTFLLMREMTNRKNGDDGE